MTASRYAAGAGPAKRPLRRRRTWRRGCATKPHIRRGPPGGPCKRTLQTAWPDGLQRTHSFVMAKLTPKQERFCEEYLVDLNATQAAIRAGYSARSAHNIGPGNLLKPIIQARIQELMKARSLRTQITADRVLQEIATLAFSDVTDYAVDEDGKVVLNSEDRGQRRALSTVKTKSRTVRKGDFEEIEHDVEVKLWNKPRALEMLCRHTDLL